MKVNVLTRIARNEKVDRVVQWAAKESVKVNKENKHIKIDKESQQVTVTNLQTLKKHLPPILAACFTSYYIANTVVSKKIPEKRKPIFITNHILTGIIGIAGGYALTDWVKRFSKTLGERFEKINAEIPEKDIIVKGLKSMVPLLAFAFTVRFLGPVIATPLADKVYNFLIKHNLLKTSQNKQK
ncbi:MAG: hypothetical protein PHC34_01960 [Candidatus Gastranaerophilales bacterium]|nr:hypothetical protein [Candidatus Gastranaerophilales bacterium]